jgi:hypothetical protein
MVLGMVADILFHQLTLETWVYFSTMVVQNLYKEGQL